MKQGKSLTELAQELDRQAKTRRDFVAPTSKLRAMVIGRDSESGPREGRVVLTGFPSGETMGINALAHQQIASDLAIPKPYYDRMVTEAPALLADNVNHWLRAQPQDRLVRTLDGNVRAFLSSKYRPLDNFELINAVIPAFKDLGGGLTVESCEVTERRLYIKAVLPSLAMDLAMAKREAMIKAGVALHAERPGEDVVQAAVTIRNSEVGEGGLYVEEGVYRLVCYNLATVAKTLRKYHVGRKHGRGNGNGHGSEEDGQDVWQLLSDEARAADDTAFWLRVRDVAKAAFSPERFNVNALKLAGAAADVIEGKVEKVVEVTAVRFGLSDSTRENVLQRLIKGADLSRFGLINAVTAASQDETDYDRASDLERLGGQIIEMPRSEWSQLAKAA